jgi:hypothetical protein
MAVCGLVIRFPTWSRGQVDDAVQSRGVHNSSVGSD